MASVLKATWEPSPNALLSRRSSRGCDYETYLPDPLEGRAFTLDGSTAADVADAERALVRFNASPAGLADSEALARLLLRAESVASSKIEGLEVGSRRLLKAQLAAELGAPGIDLTATEVLANIDAMRWAVETLGSATAIEVADLQRVHARLLGGTPLGEYGGVLRRAQNWIGGSSFNPCSAAFVPPPPDRVEPLLADLCRFCNGDELPAVAQAAIAHAQFETIHPFVDGNGRTGRALIHVILRRRGLTPRALAPISLVLATRAEDYVAGLTATRYLGAPNTNVAIAGLNAWVGSFAAAVQRAVADAEIYQARVTEIQAEWRTALTIRSGSAADLLVAALPGAPVITVPTAAGLIGRSLQATNEAVRRLADAGILQQTTAGRRNRAFEASALIDAFTALERQLASPGAETRSAPPERPVPRRPEPRQPASR